MTSSMERRPTQQADEFSLWQWLAEMSATSELLAGTDDLGEVLRRLALRAKEVTNADFAAISTFDDAGILNRFVYIGIDEQQARRLGSPPVGRGLLGELAGHDRPIRLDDLQSHPRFTGWPEGHPDMLRFLGAPIRAGGATIGSLYMTRNRGAAPFSDADEVAASFLALQAAVSLANALARDRYGRIALLEERIRIAQDLHDWTVQSLYALGLEADALAHDPELTPEAQATFASSVVRINELIKGVRDYIASLEADGPAGQPELSRDLAFVLRQLVPRGVDIIFNVSAPVLQELTARESEDLLSVAREAISNAVRHGEPTKIAVDLRQTDEETTLTIQDNGVGFDPLAVGHGLGTVTMRTRSQRLDAKLHVMSIPGMGTTIRLCLPRGGYGEQPPSDRDQHPE